MRNLGPREIIQLTVIAILLVLLPDCTRDSDAPPVLHPDGGSLPLAGSGPVIEYDAGSEPDAEVCASVAAVAKPVVPTVTLIVDGSSSMSEFFGNGLSRWDSARDAIIGPNGLVPQLTRNVRFGLVQYAGGGNQECVQLRTSPAAQNNAELLRAEYLEDPIAGGTPTDKALEFAFQTPADFYILATDGQPNRRGCDNAAPSTDPVVEAKVVDLARGKPLFLVSLAGSDPGLMAHMQDVSAVTVSKTAPYVPSTRDALVKVFRDIIGTTPCTFELNGRVLDVGAGIVTLNGQVITEYTIEGSSLTLTGAACDEFTSRESNLKAEFACASFIPE